MVNLYEEQVNYFSIGLLPLLSLRTGISYFYKQNYYSMKLGKKNFLLNLSYLLISFYWETPQGQHKRVDRGILGSEIVRTALRLGKVAYRERGKENLCSYRNCVMYI